MQRWVGAHLRHLQFRFYISTPGPAGPPLLRLSQPQEQLQLSPSIPLIPVKNSE